MTITALPTPPSRDDPANFSARADAFLSALPTFATEANALAADVNTDASDAAASAAAAIAASGATKWVSGTTYAEGDVVWSPITYFIYRRKSAGAGTTDPSSDSTNWALVGGSLASPLAVVGNSSAGAEIRLPEDTDNGSNYVAIKAPNSIAANVTYTIPGTDGTSGQALQTNGSGELSFATLGIPAGGTGATTLTANAVILGNGTSAVQFVSPGANGNVLTSNGTTWVSASASATLTGQTDSATPFETSLGYQAGNVSTGVNNTFIGYQAGRLNTSGQNNVALGYKALDANVTANGSVAIGSLALASSTVGATAIGRSALYLNTTGISNTAVGDAALEDNTTGSYNTAVGANALANNTGNGQYNTAVGANAGVANTSGQYNTILGYFALDANTTGSQNTAIGRDALGANTTGQFNVAIGSLSSDELTTGSNNTTIGYNTEASSNTASNQIVIGSGVTGQADSNVTIGSSTGKIYNAYTVNATWTQTSDGTMKNVVGPDTLGLSFIKRLNPIKYTWKPRNELPLDHPYYSEVNHADTTTVIHGFVAQEVKAALDAEGCTTFNGWDQGSDGIQAISREMFISPLVKAIQELAEKVESLEARLQLL